jgi:hypothetical protein
MHLLSGLSVLLGGSALVVAAMKNGGAKPRSALLLLLTSNLAFWLSFSLWHLRLRSTGPSPGDSIETFAGTLAEWCMLLTPFSVYEAVVFLRGVIGGTGRLVSVSGIAALLLQTVTSLRLAYSLVQGV